MKTSAKPVRAERDADGVVRDAERDADGVKTSAKPVGTERDADGVKASAKPVRAAENLGRGGAKGETPVLM